MLITSLDDFIWDSEPPKKPHRPSTISVKIENHNGNAFFDAELVTIEIEEVDMSINTAQPLTLGWAIGLTSALFVSALAFAIGTYVFIHSDVNDLRTSVDSVRDGASSDVTSLRTDMRADFARMDAKFDKVGDKLDKITDIVTETKIQQSKNQQ